MEYATSGYFWVGLILILFIGLPLAGFILRAVLMALWALIAGIAHGIRHHEW